MALLAGLLVALLALSGCTPPGPQPDRASSQKLPSGTDVQVVFPGHSDITAKMAPAAVTPEMSAGLDGTTGVITDLTDFKVDQGSFPSSGAQVSFTRTTPLPDNVMSAIAHWNDQEKKWEPVKTSLSQDRKTLTATVQHFSSYSVINFFQDLAGSLVGDHDAKERIVNGTQQWLGNQAEPPNCRDKGEGEPPAWADVTGIIGLSNMISSCSGSPQGDPDTLLVKVTMNRTYAGYFLTAITPDKADPVNDFPDRFFDWKKLFEHGYGEASTLLPQSTRVYPVMPLQTYRFEFTKATMLKAGPTLREKENQGHLITAVTDPTAVISGQLMSLVDYWAADGKDSRLHDYGTLLISLNDCWKVQQLIKEWKQWPSADDVLAGVNCLMMADNKTFQTNIEKFAGIHDPNAPAEVPKGVSKLLGKLAKGTNWAFACVAALEFGTNFGTMLTDFLGSSADQRVIGFNPSAAAMKLFVADKWVDYTTPDGSFTFTYPTSWKVQPSTLKDQYPHGPAFDVIDGSNQVIARLITGNPGTVGSFNAVPDGTNGIASLDHQVVPRVKPMGSGTEVAYHYTTYNADDRFWSATMGVYTFRERATTGGGCFFESSASCATFERYLSSTDKSPVVDPSLTGIERLKAFQKTPEYEKTKTMMTSLRNAGAK